MKLQFYAGTSSVTRLSLLRHPGLDPGSSFFDKLGAAASLRVGTFLSTLLLSGCSYIYDLKAVVIHGRLAFIVDPNSNQSADCIRSIHVKTADGEKIAATPGPDDAPGLVANGVFWWKDTAIDACPNKFPILYGQTVSGRPFVYSEGDVRGVEPKPLVPGVIYDVDTGGSGSGYGSGRFRIRPDHSVENLSIADAADNMITPDNTSG